MVTPGSEDFSLVSVHCLRAHDARDPDEWFADSGATRHMSDQRQLMHNFKHIPPGSWTVSGIGDKELEATGYGDIHVRSSVDGNTLTGIVNNVLFVPGLGVNLISIGAMTSRGLQVHFSGSEVAILSNGKVQMKGRRTGSTLYRLDLEAVTQPEHIDGNKNASLYYHHIT